MRLPHVALALTVVALLVSIARADVPIFTHEGQPYVDLGRLGADVKGKLDTKSDAVYADLRVNGHLVRFTRNWARVLIDGSPLVLDAPVRVKDGRWIVPKSFVSDVLPRLLPAAAVREPIALDEMRVRSYPSFTRVVLETSAPVSQKLDGTEGKTMRVRIFGLDGRARTEEVGDNFVDTVKLARAGADSVLSVHFTGTPGDLKASTLSDPPRLVLDFMKPSETGPRPTAQTAGPLRTIVLDAGHGGHDPGATGPGGLMEKEVVLDVTKRVAKLVDAKLGIKVLLSRDSDHFVPLKDRTSFANRERADLFVSIHANAHPSGSQEGVETFFLSSEATDIAARRTAALENSVVQLEKPAARAGGNGPQDLLRAVLWDLAQSDFLVESSRLAEVVQDSMTRALRIPNRGVKQAGFYVLGGAAMPAILIEIGFVTNKKEEKRLRESKYRDEIARAIFSGIEEYKRNWDQRMRASTDSR